MFLNIITVLGIIFLNGGVISCSDRILDDINRDASHPLSVEAKYILADVITSTAFYNTGGDMNTYLAVYVEHEKGVHNQLLRAETRSGEPQLATTFNNKWESLYNTLKDARIALSICSKGGRQADNSITRGIAEVMIAYNSALITDFFGDVPWSEAALIDEAGRPLHMSPKIDRQEEIYENIFTLLDAAIADLQGTDSHAMGSYDLLYGGDNEKWLKFAYGLKARYTMRLLHRAANKAAEYDKILDYISKSFTSTDEQAAFAVYDDNNLNPLFDFQWSRDGLGASESLADKLIERDDPRIRRVFIDADLVQVEDQNAENFLPAPNGEPDERQYYYNTSAFVYSQTAPTLFLSYHELLFLKAEALARKGDPGAKAVLREAVIAGIANSEISVAAAFSSPAASIYLEETTAAITEDEAAEYFDSKVSPLFDLNPLKEVMVQKYLAFFGASGESPEAYNDIRRLRALDEGDFITLANPNNAEGKFPLRCGYGTSDVTTNPAVQAAFGNGQYVYTENVWWAGGTR
ncbi:MAG: SusD/RagB family nutrient-binding outer membrane lipoprotein [Prevotellaceae bacterium]|nr:SusD/RagB family nutrient-binding outer membrane lipoprotein [Prevotellaceae bacterium]